MIILSILTGALLWATSFIYCKKIYYKFLGKTKYVGLDELILFFPHIFFSILALVQNIVVLTFTNNYILIYATELIRFGTTFFVLYLNIKIFNTEGRAELVELIEKMNIFDIQLKD